MSKESIRLRRRRGMGGQGMNTEPQFITDPLDLLTEDERRQLHADLAEMARQRRRAEIESASLEMP